ncbi:hypothetical protein HPP92_025175 [Vanilla planifolia]|uniref:Uncharacterized protein n=1 Tax=Vanilla planifolia TaxID=51239 RepID=A0A835PEW4_VANPL|nr:hypothetical protein HPP92_025175 [Vanilla planifolia]
METGRGYAVDGDQRKGICSLAGQRGSIVTSSAQHGHPRALPQKFLAEPSSVLKTTMSVLSSCTSPDHPRRPKEATAVHLPEGRRRD